MICNFTVAGDNCDIGLINKAHPSQTLNIFVNRHLVAQALEPLIKKALFQPEEDKISVYK